MSTLRGDGVGVILLLCLVFTFYARICFVFSINSTPVVIFIYTYPLLQIPSNVSVNFLNGGKNMALSILFSLHQARR